MSIYILIFLSLIQFYISTSTLTSSSTSNELEAEVKYQDYELVHNNEIKILFNK